MSISRVMDQGKSALAANQIGLTTVSHNISNSNTEGYSRQRVDMVTNEPSGLGGLRLGGGVRVGSVTRSASDFVNRRLEEENTNLGKFEGMSDIMTQLETVLKDDGEQGISKSVSRFFDDVRTLSMQPESAPLRAAVRESANSITTRFQNVANGVSQVRNDLDRRIEGAVTDVNMLTKRIADLNRRITEIEVQGNGVIANDERDSRDLALQQLAKVVDIRVTPIENGGINVSAGRLGVLVGGVEATEFKGVHDQGDGGGAIRIRQVGYDGHIGKDVTDLVEGGSLGGFIKVRDETIPDVQNKINSLAYNLATSVNQVHEKAYSTNGDHGTDFFAPITDIRNAATQFRISDDVLSDSNKVAGALKLGASGDNRALLDIADLQDKKIFNKGTATFADQAAGIVGNLGVELKSVNESLDTQRGLVEQLTTAQQQVSGVSLDEEAVHMLQFQKAFDASAKLIQVADSCLETVLNLKRF